MTETEFLNFAKKGFNEIKSELLNQGLVSTQTLSDLHKFLNELNSDIDYISTYDSNLPF